jgi:predicted enzyme related to lactoylglutathione lyase
VHPGSVSLGCTADRRRLAEEAEMTGRVVHFEIPFDDQERASSFYTDAFGWKLTAMPEMSYVLVTTGPSDQGPPSEPGFINGGMMRRELPLGTPVITVDVEDIDASLRTIENLGGTTVSAKQAVGDMGFAAYFKDSEGNLLGLWQNA